MVDKDTLQTVEARRREVAAEIARLQAEDAELEVVERVLKRLGGLDEAKQAQPKMGPPRPSGAPTTFEMAEMVLASAEKEGKDGLSAQELIDAIRGRYWPGLMGQQILPTIYQLARAGRLHKTPKGKFKRIKNNEGTQE